MIKNDCPSKQNRLPSWNFGVILNGYLYCVSNDTHKLYKLSFKDSEAVLLGCTGTSNKYVFYDKDLEVVEDVEVKLEGSIDLPLAMSGHQMIVAGGYLAITSWNDYHYFQRQDLLLLNQDLEIVAGWLNTDMKGLDAIACDKNYIYVIGYQDFLIYDFELNRIKDSYIGGFDYSSMIMIDGVIYAAEWWYQTVSKIIPSIQNNTYITSSREIDSQLNNIVYFKGFLFTFGYSYKTYPYDIFKLDLDLVIKNKVYHGFTIAPTVVLGGDYMYVLDDKSNLFRVDQDLNISNLKTTHLIGLVGLI